jgi:hypothetical protein
MAELMQVGVPYPVLLEEYKERVGTLTNEIIMLRAMITYMQNPPAPAPSPEPPAVPTVPEQPQPDVPLATPVDGA